MTRTGSSPVSRTRSSVHKVFDLWTLDFCFLYNGSMSIVGVKSQGSILKVGVTK